MSMHLEVLAPIMPPKEAIPNILYDILEASSEYYQPAKGIAHFRTKMVDRFSGEIIGHFSSSVVEDRENHMNRLLDVDISFVN